MAVSGSPRPRAERFPFLKDGQGCSEVLMVSGEPAS